jgi:hypothetical protein
MEFPEVDRNHFENITKNFSKDMNYNLNRWLEFREKINTIQNFDIMKFTQSYETIEIDEKAVVQKWNVNRLELAIKISKIVKRTKQIYELIKGNQKSIWLFREETILLYLADWLPYGFKEKIVDPLYQELKKIKKSGKLGKLYKDGIYCRKIAQMLKSCCGKNTYFMKFIDDHMESIEREWREEKSLDVKLWRDTVALEGDWYREKFLRYERNFNKEYKEPKEIGKFSYEIGRNEEIESLHKWAKIKRLMKEQEDSQFEKSYLLPENERKLDEIVIIEIRTRDEEEISVHTELDDWKELESVEYIREIDKWYLKPKGLNWKQKRKKKGKWKKFRERRSRIRFSFTENVTINDVLEKITKKVRIKCFGKPFRKESNDQRNIYKILEGKESNYKEQLISKVDLEAKEKDRICANDKDDAMVENQFKTLAKAYTGFRPIVLRIEGFLLEKVEKDQNSMMLNNKDDEKGEVIRKLEKYALHNDDKGDGKGEIQLKNLTKVTAGNLEIVLSNDEMQIKKNISKDTKS